MTITDVPAKPCSSGRLVPAQKLVVSYPVGLYQTWQACHACLIKKQQSVM